MLLILTSLQILYGLLQWSNDCVVGLLWVEADLRGFEGIIDLGCGGVCACAMIKLVTGFQNLLNHASGNKVTHFIV